VLTSEAQNAPDHQKEIPRKLKKLSVKTVTFRSTQYEIIQIKVRVCDGVLFRRPELGFSP